MATYAELDAASSNATLLLKTRVACVIAAEAIRLESTDTNGHGLRLAWARQTLANPAAMAVPMLWCVLAQNQSQTNATILAASDATVLTAVNAAINAIAGVQ